MTQPALTLLQQANKALRDGRYQEADELYCQIAKHSSYLVPTIRFNLTLSRKRQGLPHCDQTVSALVAPKNQTITTKQSSECLEKVLESALNDSAVTKAHLTDLHNIKNTEDGFHATNDDPYFWIKPSQPLKAGFYILELKLTLTSKQSRYAAKIYNDYGQGFNENDTVVTFAASGERVLRIVKFKKDTQALRFDPLETMSKFTIDAFNLTLVTVEQAVYAMISLLAEKNRPLPTKDISYIKNLYQTYDSVFKVPANKVSYEEWIERVEMPSLPSASTLQQTLAAFNVNPVFSVVMPTYNTDEHFLRLCIESVINQSYPHWELCIADDNSPQKHVVKVLDQYAAQDKRIKIVKRTQNGHISKATNSAIELATGDFIVLLDHDDELANNALYFMAERINQYPDAKILYSDEDKIDTEGNRSNPHFKSDWNPDLFFSQNYVSHLGVYKTEIIQKIGGFRTGVEGSQDQDLLLRCLPHVKHSEIQHIPRVLYHWRMIEGSTALAAGEKSYTTEAGIKALQDYFKANGPKDITVQQGVLANTYKVNWPLPKPEPLVSLLIPTRDRKQITQVAVDSILEKTTYQHYEIIILDNGSVEQETLDWFKDIQQQDKRVKVLRYDHPFNYSAINNFGVKHAKGSIIGLINNDIEVISPDWLSEMVSLSIRKDIGCVGAKLYYGNDQIQHAGVILGIGGVANHSHKMFKREHPGYFGRLVCRQNLSAVTAAVLLVRKDIYEQVNGLDEVNLHVAFNDVDFCLKVREAGYRNIWTPYAELYHHESISRGHEDTPEKKARFKKEVDFMKYKWGDNLKNDPFYSPNLTKDREDFSIGVKYI